MEVLLYNIRSHYNVGAIFRTADGAGVSKLYLAGITPAPVDRFGRRVPEIHKTALGAEAVLSWESVKTEDVKNLLLKKQQAGFQIVVVEQHTRSIRLNEFKPQEKIIYVFGGEIEGVSEEIVAIADTVLALPMHGIKESLNVSVTAGIVLYHNGIKVS